jgi:hypothetical protein
MAIMVYLYHLYTWRWCVLQDDKMGHIVNGIKLGIRDLLGYLDITGDIIGDNWECGIGSSLALAVDFPTKNNSYDPTGHHGRTPLSSLAITSGLGPWHSEHLRPWRPQNTQVTCDISGIVDAAVLASAGNDLSVTWLLTFQRFGWHTLWFFNIAMENHHF